MSGRILSLFDLSGIAVAPWIAAGYTAEIVDLQHPPGGHVDGSLMRWGGDIRKWDPSFTYSFVFAFPPCTDLANSGARWFKGKGLRKLSEAIELVSVAAEMCEGLGAPYCIENPIGQLSTYWRKPDHIFDPCDYAGYLADPTPEAYTKKTCLWTGHGFKMPEPRRVEPILGSKMHRLPPSPERANLRSQTPRGFSQAVFEANGKLPPPRWQHQCHICRNETTGTITEDGCETCREEWEAV